MTWLDGWSYRRSVTLSRPSGAMADYQMKLLLGESSGSIGSTVNCNGDCESTFNDIRFVNVSGTQLNYWIESVTGTTPNQIATVWVKFDYIDAITTTFYMYYGNPSASGVTTGSGTFLLFDDFTGATLDNSKWSDYGGTTIVSGTMVATASSSIIYGIKGLAGFGGNHALRARSKTAHANTTSYIEYPIRWTNSDDNQQSAIATCHTSSTYNYKYYTYINPNGTQVSLTGVNADTFYVYDVMRNGTTDVRFLTDGGNASTIATYVSSATMYPLFGAYGAGSIMTLDWALVRKYNVTEPTWGDWGEQEYADGAPWLTGWNYRKKFSMISTPAVSGYQVKLKLGETLTSPDAQVHCNGLCDSDFDDVRFTTFDGITLLPYFIESTTGVSPAKTANIWIKTDYIGTKQTSFYLYYGNSSATIYSNAGATMEFYDDFLGSSLDTSNWHHWFTNGSYTVSGSILQLTGGSSLYEGWGCKRQFGTNYAYRGKVKVSAESGNDIGIFGFDDRSATGSYVGSGADAAVFRVGSSVKYFQLKREGTSTENARSDVLTSWSIVEIRRNASSNAEFLINDVSKGTYSTNLPLDVGGVVLYSNENTISVYSDWVSMRKYVSPEPSFVGFQLQEPALEMGWIAGWSNRLPMTVAGSNILESSPRFPMMIYLDSTCSGVFSELGNNSRRISLRLADYTECYVEVESWDASTQKAVLWAGVPVISGSNFNMYLFYDNNHPDNTGYVGLTAETAAKNVWDTNYKCVLHFAQTPAGTGSVKDSTINANHGNPGATATLTEGNYGKAYDFDSSTTGYVQVPDHASLDFTNQLTMNALVQFDVAINGMNIIGKNTTGSTYAWGLYVAAVGCTAWGDEAGTWAPLWSANDAITVTPSAWFMVTGTFNGTTMKIYRNGVYVTSHAPSTTSLYNSAGPINIGYNSEWSQKMDGRIAHMSVAAIARSDAYMQMTYLSLMNRMIVLGSSESAPAPTSYTKMLKLTISESKIDTNLTDFPVLVYLSLNSGLNNFSVYDVFYTLESDDNRKKFAITTVSGSLDQSNQCYVEIERWNTATSEAWLWVKVPTVYSGSDTSLYMYYGTEMEDNTSFVGDTNSVAARNVWDSNFIAVYHCNQDPSGGAGVVLDSTSNANHGTPQGSMVVGDLVTSSIGLGYDLDGANDYIQMPTGVSCKGDTQSTIECMIYTRATPSTNAGIIYESTSSAGYTRHGIFWATDDKVAFYVRDSDSGSAIAATTSLAAAKNNWLHVCGVNNSADDYNYIYVNAAISGSNVTARGAYTNTNSADPIAFGAAGSNYINAIIDEVRISDTTRSGSWVKATYHSNIDDLITFGPVEYVVPLYSFAGYVVDADQNPVSRVINFHRRDTGELIGSTTSSGDGSYYFETTYSGTYYIVALDDSYNLARLDRMVPISI